DRLVKPQAFVVLKDPATGNDKLADELKAFVKDKIAPYKYPRWIDFVVELPKTATGKIQRFKLRAREPRGRCSTGGWRRSTPIICAITSGAAFAAWRPSFSRRTASSGASGETRGFNRSRISAAGATSSGCP